jgi:hypothetical protein
MDPAPAFAPLLALDETKENKKTLKNAMGLAKTNEVGEDMHSVSLQEELLERKSFCKWEEDIIKQLVLSREKREKEKQEFANYNFASYFPLGSYLARR